MKDLVFITGNQHKADYLAKWLGRPIQHQKVDLDEVQSLDLRRVVRHKAEQAYDQVRRPVLVEDIGLSFTALGRLPGTLTKWFIEEMGNDGLCKLAARLEHQEAEAAVCYGLHDGQKVHFFEARMPGKIAPKPRGDHGFGWNPIFIPKGTTKTYGEMTEQECLPFNVRAHAIEKLRAHLSMV